MLEIKVREKEYDYIFIDEAQDLQDGIIKIFYKLTDKILITFDDSQKVSEDYLLYNYKNKSNLLANLNIEESFYDLIENYCNTKETEILAKLFLSSYGYNELSLCKVTAQRHGEVPKLVHIDDDYNNKDSYSFDAKNESQNTLEEQIVDLIKDNK